jgi:PTH1 family peptidyl-tRNA hydrolase
LAEKRLIVGLGNPGTRYRYTRHNLGFLVVEKLAEKIGLKLSLSSFTNGITAEGSINETDIILLMPLTYMNNSGVAVGHVANREEIASEDLLVICDDLNLPFGQIRLRGKGSDGGHNGLSSLIQKLATEKFSRLRMGIGESKGMETVDYVLEEFDRAEKKQLDGFIDQAADCCQMWLGQGLDRAMEQFNRKQ